MGTARPSTIACSFQRHFARVASVLLNPFRLLATMNVPSGCAEILIQ
jgi:hypothetical protein